MKSILVESKLSGEHLYVGTEKKRNRGKIGKNEEKDKEEKGKKSYCKQSLLSIQQRQMQQLPILLQ